MKFKIVCITGNEQRHKYVVKTLSEKFDIIKVFYEQKANVHEKFETTPEEKKIIQKHFELRRASESKYFSGIEENPSINSEYVETGKVNNEKTIEEIVALAPDYIILYGSSIIKAPLLKVFERKVINIHLGLSPYYRGSGTNFWPLFYNEPESVGATIHLATSKVDAGDILYQVRPIVVSGDNIHDFGNKTIIAATEVLYDVVAAYNKDTIVSDVQDLSNSKLCRRKDLTAQAIEAVYQNFENGLVANYLANKLEKDGIKPIFQPALYN
jgi:methionyl-tRNA formyltransferase